MADTRSEEFRKMQAERRELVQLAIEELVKRNGYTPSSRAVAEELGMADGDIKTIRRDWDWLHKRGKVPERPGQLPGRRFPGENFGGEGGGAFLEIEALLHRVTAELGSASPEYRKAVQEFWVTHLGAIKDLADQAMALALGGTIDELISSINEKGR